MNLRQAWGRFKGFFSRGPKIEAAASRYEGARFNRLVMDWVTSSLGLNPSPWERQTLQERSQDRVRNDPIAASIPDTMTMNAVGPGLKPQSRLRADRLGISDTEAEDLQGQAEDAFNAWVPWADAAGRLDFYEIQTMVLRKIIEDGEILVNLPVLSEALRPLGRALELVSADRLATPLGISRPNIFQGIELGPERKEPRKYWLRKAPANIGDIEITNYDFVGIPAYDGQGRPMILHIFPSQQPGQARGVPLFAPVLKYFKNMGDSLDAEVVAQKVAACMTAVITRSADNLGLPGLPTVTDAATGQKLTKLEPGMIPTLEIGEDLKLIDFKRGGETFQVFLTTVLRIIGNTLGLPYESLLKDFSKTNYSSARAALLEAWRVYLFWRSWLTRKLCQPVWELVLEEAYLRGQFAARNFYANRQEYCRAVWIGPGRGWVDPIKEIIAAKLEEDFSYATLADQCAAQGRDWEDVLKQRAREQKRLKELGLPTTMLKNVQVSVQAGEQQIDNPGPGSGQTQGGA
jgi:lambda family phage portal protein